MFAGAPDRPSPIEGDNNAGLVRKVLWDQSISRLSLKLTYFKSWTDKEDGVTTAAPLNRDHH